MHLARSNILEWRLGAGAGRSRPDGNQKRGAEVAGCHEGRASDNYFGCDCSMLETLYQTILHDPSL